MGEFSWGHSTSLVWDIKEHEKSVTCFSLHESSDSLLRGSTDKTIRYWEFIQIPSWLPFTNHPNTLLADLWSNHFPDPFQVLDQIPFGVHRDETITSLSSHARVDWKETPEGRVIMLDVPGLKRDAIKIEVEGNRVLRVSGERKRKEEKEGDHWHRVERSYGKFWRQFKVPDNVDLDFVKAKMENRVLTLTMNNLSPDKVKGPRLVSIAGDDEQAPKLKGNEDKQEL
ncbi:hypothetical protein JHK86_055574 [Glycine max]|nr:hypothetical protein JHK86_055574 [Glycine max]